MLRSKQVSITPLTETIHLLVRHMDLDYAEPINRVIGLDGDGDPIYRYVMRAWCPVCDAIHPIDHFTAPRCENMEVGPMVRLMAQGDVATVVKGRTVMPIITCAQHSLADVANLIQGRPEWDKQASRPLSGRTSDRRRSRRMTRRLG